MTVVTVDLLKMHPMARKMNAHNEAFAKAIEEGDVNVAKEHLGEILKYANTLEDDIHFAIKKGAEVITPQSGWEQQSPILKFNESGSKFDPSQRDRQLPGTIFSAKTNPGMRPARSTFGRSV